MLALFFNFKKYGLNFQKNDWVNKGGGHVNNQKYNSSLPSVDEKKNETNNYGFINL